MLSSRLPHLLMILVAGASAGLAWDFDSLLRQVSPQLAVDAGFIEDRRDDPWGTSWRWEYAPGEEQFAQRGVYCRTGIRYVEYPCSVGPDGVPDGRDASDDDLRPRYVTGVIFAFLDDALLVTSLLLLCSVPWLQSPRGSLQGEALRIALIAGPPGVLAAWRIEVAHMSGHELPTLAFVPWEIAATFTMAFALAVMGCLVRFRPQLTPRES